MKHTLKTLTAAAMLSGSAFGANTMFADGDLVMYFQELGGDEVVYANLGSAASYRGTAAGKADAVPVINIAGLESLGATLNSAFGPGWQSNTNLFVGIAGAFANVEAPIVEDGDPWRTSYVSSARNTIGNIFQKNSTTKSVSGNGAMTTVSSGIIQMNTAFRNGPNQTVGTFGVGSSTIDEQNPINVVAGNVSQGPAFSSFSGGNQQRGGASALGTVSDFGIGSVEFALDLYRLYGDTDTALPGAVSASRGQGTYEGTFFLRTDGNVSFVPEPSSLALVGLGAGVLAFRRRRNA